MRNSGKVVQDTFALRYRRAALLVCASIPQHERPALFPLFRDEPHIFEEQHGRLKHDRAFDSFIGIARKIVEEVPEVGNMWQQPLLRFSEKMQKVISRRPLFRAVVEHHRNDYRQRRGFLLEMQVPDTLLIG